MSKNRTNKTGGGKLWGVFAASQMGKGVWIKQQLRAMRPARLLIWDYLGEYGDFAKAVTTLPALAGAVVAAKSGPVAVRYMPRCEDSKRLRVEFSAFCAIAYAAVGAVVVCEELSMVTTASFAPPAWGKLCTMGVHHQRLHVIGVSQFPAQVDMSYRGSCTLLHVGALRADVHRVAMARELDVSPAEILALEQFEYLEKDFIKAPKLLVRGRVTP